MRSLLALGLLLTAAGASAQTTAAPAGRVRPIATLGVGPMVDGGDGVLVSAQGSVGARAGIVTGRIRGTAATDFGLYTDQRERWEIAALGGVLLGERTQVFVGAGPGLTGGTIHRECYRSFDCSDDEIIPTTLGLALGLEVTRPLKGTTRIGIRASANLNRTQSTAGIGLILGFGR